MSSFGEVEGGRARRVGPATALRGFGAGLGVGIGWAGAGGYIWRFMCRARWSEREKARSHRWHWNGRWPVCLR